MRYARLRRCLPPFLRRHLLYFEAAIEEAVSQFAAELPAGARLLDAGAGECRYARCFPRQRYVGVDLGIGDAQWDYTRLDVIGDLLSLPFRAGSFEACLSVVTLEHMRDPARAVAELARALRPGGRLLVVAPQDWEVHQAPHDYFRFTRYGLRHLLEIAGFMAVHIQPMGGLFRLMSRRLLNALEYFPGIWFPIAACALAPLALVLPVFDRLDRDRKFTLGYVCTARKR